MSVIPGPVGLAVDIAKPIATTIASATPSKIERKEKGAIGADQEALAGAAGGMSRGEYATRLGSAIGQTQALQRQAYQDLAATGNSDVASGLAQQRALQVAQQGQLAGEQAIAQTNLSDQQMAAQRRFELAQRVQAQIARDEARKQLVLGNGTAQQPGIMAQQNQQLQDSLGGNVASAYNKAKGVQPDAAAGLKAATSGG